METTGIEAVFLKPEQFIEFELQKINQKRWKVVYKNRFSFELIEDSDATLLRIYRSLAALEKDFEHLLRLRPVLRIAFLSDTATLTVHCEYARITVCCNDVENPKMLNRSN